MTDAPTALLVDVDDDVEVEPAPEDPSPLASSGASSGGRAGRRAAVVAGVSVAALLAAVVYHLVQGAAEVGVGDLVDFVAGRAAPQIHDIFTGSRLPRTGAGLVAGAALGVAGVLLQAATRNPLAEPATTGVSAGAFAAVVVATVVGFHPDGLARPGLAFVGGLAAATLTYLVASGGSAASPTRVVLAGMTVTLALMSLAGVLLVLFEQETSGMFLWGQGTLVQNDYGRVGPAAAVAAVSAAAIAALPRRLDLLGLGDEASASLGLQPARTRGVAIGLAVVLTAAAVSTAGPLAFVGLLAAHLVRLAGVTRHRWLLPLSALWGAVVVLVADGVAQQHVSRILHSELPVGVFTALVGAPALVLLARRLPAASAPAMGRLRAGAARSIPYPVAVGLGATALVVALVSGLMLGDLDLSPLDVLRALVPGAPSDLTHTVVVDLRLPRLVVAALAGASLAACGSLLQGVSRNPLADPSVIGVTGGAAVGGLTLLLVVDGLPASYVPFGAFVGGLLAVALVLALTYRNGALAPERLVLVGVAVAAFTTALAHLLVVLSPLELTKAISWLVGTTYARDWDQAAALVGWPAVLIPVAFVAGRHLDLLAYGDDLAGSLGLRVDRTRLLAVVVAVLLAAAAVAAVGTIGFVGLVAPHAARTLVGARTRRVLVMAALLGAALVAAADTTSRVVLAPREVPSGLVVAVLGAPYFVFLLWRAGEEI